MVNMLQHLARMVDRLEEAKFKPNEVALTISKSEEKHLLVELRALTNLTPETVHGAKLYGWSIIVDKE